MLGPARKMRGAADLASKGVEPIMAELLANNFRYRRSFSKIPVVTIGNLISVQKESYDQFLQTDVRPEQRKSTGLQAVFRSVFPIKDFSGKAELQFVGYELEAPKYDVDECRERGMTFSAPLKVTVRLVVWEVDPETAKRKVYDMKESDVYFGEIPLMTENGTFIVNGTERVVVSQLHRSPGIFFDENPSKTGGAGKLIYSARIIPNRGSWIDFEFDTKDILYVRIDRRRKLPATVLLRALGYSTEDLLNYFYQREKFSWSEDGWKKATPLDLLNIQSAPADVVHPETGELILRKGSKFNKQVQRKLKAAGLMRTTIELVDGKESEIELSVIPTSEEDVIGRVSAYDVVDMNTGEILVECNEEVKTAHLKLLSERGIDEIELLYIDGKFVGSFLRDTLGVDKISTKEEAIIEIYRRLRPGDPPTYDAADAHFHNLFFNAERYDLSAVGRHKLNHKLGLNLADEQTTLTREDILKVVQYLINLKNKKGQVDDIDHLGNRRVRAVGELLENQYRVGLVRMEKAIKERMSLSEIEALTPADLINAKPVSAVIKEFFGSSQLSQFMDQTNPLSEVTHKRRLSALGPGGLTRERAGFDVRDVHPTHYGRICPIETPEGPNIGLIASLSTYAKVDHHGFIRTPYRLVEGGRPSDQIIYFSALDEEEKTIAQANTPIDAEGRFADTHISARKGGDFVMVPREQIQLMDVSANQLVSVAASLVPFLENDDANRALMGSNMQRQAVPLVRTDSPLVGTGMEPVVARDSGVTTSARRDGIVEYVDASRIVIKTEDPEAEGIGDDVDIYNLTKFQRSNQNTCINQRPVVQPGDRVSKREIIADGPATDTGELALGRNVVVAFMPWQGYNFEDSILISERLVAEDVFTSIHIEEFEVSARDTKLGKEEITRDIPNVGEEALQNLDESGIIRIGAEVKAGDILVGKITPKGETQLSPEEKLLRAIFGEKAGDVKDSSLRVPPGVEGTVIGCQIFAREGVEKDQRSLEIEEYQKTRIFRDRDEKIRTVRDSAARNLLRIVRGRKSLARILDDNTGGELIVRGEEFTPEILRRLTVEQYERIQVEGDHTIQDQIFALVDKVREKEDELRARFAAKVERLTKGDELPPGVIKMVKVYVAIKRKLQVGDKMAGRHGNKGVISKVLPIEDMPYLEDGTPVDLVLNPLGVPSRMNVGQILETHLGWAARGMGQRIGQLLDENYSAAGLRDYLRECYPGQEEVLRFLETASEDELKRFAGKYRKGVTTATPVFAGASENEIREALKVAGRTVQTVLYDGRTGESFQNRVTVGVMYMLKLHHLVDDKIHARSIGPYSLVTQQPLGGKAQFGGQRLGEMEVWALEAYGAAYCLQEFLTVKSDDVLGRTRMYESIVKGENLLEAGLPESFNVLLKELQSLALDVDLREDKDVLAQGS
jgi:DNA-directed RNA polymerase subunit beta